MSSIHISPEILNQIMMSETLYDESNLIPEIKSKKDIPSSIIEFDTDFEGDFENITVDIVKKPIKPFIFTSNNLSQWANNNRYGRFPIEFNTTHPDAINLFFNGEIRNLKRETIYQPREFIWIYNKKPENHESYTEYLKTIETPSDTFLVWTRDPEVIKIVNDLDPSLNIRLYPENKDGKMILVYETPEHPLFKKKLDKDQFIADTILAKKLILFPNIPSGYESLGELFALGINVDFKDPNHTNHMFQFIHKTIRNVWEQRSRFFEIEIERLIEKHNPLSNFFNNRKMIEKLLKPA